MIGKHEKVIAMTLVPIRDGFWKVIPIGPKRVGVSVAFEPSKIVTFS